MTAAISRVWRQVLCGLAAAWFPAMLAGQSPATAASSVSRAQLVFADTAFFAEGLAADPRDGTLFVTSIHRRNVLVVAPDGRTRWLFDPQSPASVGAVLGAVFDPAAERLWLTTAKLPTMEARGPADSALRSELLEVSPRDGRILRALPLEDGGGIPGEIALAPDGTVLVSDGLRARLYRLRRGATALETLPSEALRSPQGIAVRPDGAVAYVADWSRGLLRWDLATDSLTPVTTTDGRLLRGVDGLRWHEGQLLGLQNGASPNRVVRVSLDSAGRGLAGLEVLDAPAPLEGEMTVGVIVGDEFVYVASSAWPLWTEDGQRRADGRALPAVVLRRLRLR